MTKRSNSQPIQSKPRNSKLPRSIDWRPMPLARKLSLLANVELCAGHAKLAEILSRAAEAVADGAA